MKIVAPTFTQTPNDLFDHWLPLLKESELKVILVIMRKTFGWHKIRDRISNSQLVKLTGQSLQSVKDAIKSLQSKGLILKEKIGSIGNEETYYELVIDDDSNNSYPAKFCPGGGLNSSPGGGQILAPQKKEQNKCTKEQQQQEELPAAVPSKNEKILTKVENPKSTTKTSTEVFECLQNVDIPESEKRWITKNYKQEDVKHAVAWATHPSTKLNKELSAAIKWACKEKPDIPKTEQQKAQENKKYAKEIERKHNGKNGHEIHALNEYIEISIYSYSFCLKYTEHAFKEQLDSELMKIGVL